MLCFSLGVPSPKTIHAEPYHLVDIQVLLSEFDIVYVTQKAIKGSALADYLAQQPLNDYQPMHPEFPDEDIMTLFEEKLDEDRDKWTVWFDGASSILGHGIGAVLVSLDNQ